MAGLTKKRLMSPEECEMEDGGSYCGGGSKKTIKDGGYKRLMDKDQKMPLHAAAFGYKPKSGPKKKVNADSVWADGFAFDTNSISI